ncbi:MAG: Ig-like domain-containing protein [Saprospiraceae bacterium]
MIKCCPILCGACSGARQAERAGARDGSGMPGLKDGHESVQPAAAVRLVVPHLLVEIQRRLDNIVDIPDFCAMRIELINNVWFWGVLLAGVLVGCANPMAPVGGPKDEQPPRIDSLRSTPDMQTNFRPQTIELTFDEWLKLDQPNQKVVISPPIQGYVVRLKGKTVIVDLGDKDTLRANVTYVVQFGDAVKDLTEGNAVKDLRYVFSTGPYIDSLTLGGKVVDAYTGEPQSGVLVMLYDNLADSVFRKERPFYFSKTGRTVCFR